jgi:hypothetical protein
VQYGRVRVLGRTVVVIMHTHLVPDYRVTAAYLVQSRKEGKCGVYAQPDDVVIIPAEVDLAKWEKVIN